MHADTAKQSPSPAADLSGFKRRQLAGWALILVVVSVLMFTTLTTMFTGLNERKQDLAASVRENALWAAFQADLEANRFIISILEALADPTAENLADLRIRYDILYSRAAILSESRFSAMFEAEPSALPLRSALRKK